MFHFNYFAGSGTAKFFVASPAIDGTDKPGELTSDGPLYGTAHLLQPKKGLTRY
jgi:hypothetical protein